MEKQKKVYTDEKCCICWGSGSQFNDGKTCWNCLGVGLEPESEPKFFCKDDYDNPIKKGKKK